MSYRRQPLAWAGVAWALAAAAPSVRAGDVGQAAAVTGSVPADQAAMARPAAQAVRAVRDKETGLLRAPTDEELKAMQQAERATRKAHGLPEDAPLAPLVVRQHANGMRSAVLGPGYLVTLKAQRTAEGHLDLTHDKALHEHVTPVPSRPATQ